jgi:hypothetical protein
MTIHNPAEIAEHGRWLLAEAEPGDWSMAAVRRLVAAGGWKAGPEGEGDGVRLVPFDEADARFSDGRGCREVAVPVVVLPDRSRSPESLAGAFRTAGTALAEALGPASSLGSHGLVGPWFSVPPSWGAPFLRWRRPGERTLELRATESGADLVLQPTEPYEGWRLHAHEWSEPGTIGGFVRERLAPGNEGLSTPGAPKARSWKQWQPMLAAFLSKLPAETAALGELLYFSILIGARPCIYVASGGDGVLEFRSYFRYVADPAALGWRRTDAQVARWLLDGGRPGTVDGDALARTLVNVLRTEKAGTPARLALLTVDDDHTVLFGLGLGGR